MIRGRACSAVSGPALLSGARRATRNDLLDFSLGEWRRESVIVYGTRRLLISTSQPSSVTKNASDDALLERLDSLRARLGEIGGAGRGRLAEVSGELESLRKDVAELIRDRNNLDEVHRDLEASLRRDVSEHRRSESELRESQRFIAAILGALTTHVAVLDDRGVVIAVNTAWERYASSGRSGSASIGLGGNYLAAVEADANRGSEPARQLATAIHHILAGKLRRFSFETADRGASGERWFSLRITAFGGGGPSRLVVARDDITERRRTEEALRQSMNRTQLILDSAVDGILTIDAKGIIESVNPAAERMFGYAASELVGRNVGVLMPSPDRERHDGYLERYQETGRKKVIGVGREVEGRRRDGTTFPLDLAVSEVFIGGERTFMGTLRDVTERKEIEEALRHQRDFAESLVETAQVIVLVLDTDARIVRFNRYFEEISGFSLEEVRGEDWFKTFLPMRDHERIRQAFARALNSMPTVGNINPIVTKTGVERQIEWYSKTLRDADGEITGVLATGHDITERLDLEEQFRQAQKLEAVGRLAGGVAHDFNTLLGSILGYGDILLDRLGAGDPLRRPVKQIRRGAERGAGLTRQLLAFSRRQVLKPEVLDLRSVLAEMDDMLRRLIGADYELEHRHDLELGPVKVDAGQIQQVIMNLVVNACDAMAGGGRIVIAAENVDVDETHADRAAVLAPGRYVRIRVSDTGCGMDEQTRKQVFEPFFTTKEQGKGTGLGLSTVYGIVRQSGGGVAVDSQPDEGSTFKVYLLRSEEQVAAAAAEAVADAPPERGSETVLLVEDDEMFLDLLSEVLEGSGYNVLAASDPAQAMELSGRHPGTVDLLISDMVMPGMSGKDLAGRLAPQRPDMKVLLMSGYSDEALEERGVSSESGFIQKPFSTRELVREVRRSLDGG